MQHKEKKLLIVDDDPDILQFLQLIFEDEGYEVQTSTKGQYLEQLHNGGLPHLILLDVFLSGKDGRDIVKHLKSQDETKHASAIHKLVLVSQQLEWWADLCTAPCAL